MTVLSLHYATTWHNNWPSIICFKIPLLCKIIANLPIFHFFLCASSEDQIKLDKSNDDNNNNTVKSVPVQWSAISHRWRRREDLQYVVVDMCVPTNPLLSFKYCTVVEKWKSLEKSNEIIFLSEKIGFSQQYVSAFMQIWICLQEAGGTHLTLECKTYYEYYNCLPCNRIAICKSKQKNSWDFSGGKVFFVLFYSSAFSCFWEESIWEKKIQKRQRQYNHEKMFYYCLTNNKNLLFACPQTAKLPSKTVFPSFISYE